MFLKYLQNFIEQRRQEMPEGSYTTTLFQKGINRMAQKVGEEAVETVIEATNGTDDRLVPQWRIRVCDRKSRFWQEQPVEILVLRNSHQSRGRMVVGL